jgi:hypothetical protein
VLYACIIAENDGYILGDASFSKALMYFRFFTLFSFCCIFSTAQAPADTILLSNGKSYEGKIISEDETTYLLELEVKKGIKDEKKFLKSDIKSITKQSPDEWEFKKLKELTPVPDLLGVMDYEERLKIVENFIKNFPRSEKLKDAKLIQENLKEELEIVRAGGIKLSLKMVTADEYLATAYTYDQLIAVRKIYRDMSNRNFLGALRLFTDYEAKFPNANSRNELIPKIKQVLLYYQSSLNESLASYDARLKSREAGLVRMSIEERMITQRALDEKMAILVKRFDAEKTMKNAWITPDAFHKESLVEALRQVDVEMKRLNSPTKNNSEMISLEDTYSEAWEKLPGASTEDQKIILDKLKRERMPEPYMTMLTERIHSKQ